MTSKPTVQTHRYYRSVIVPAMREHCGYESDAHMHRALKAGFYLKKETDKDLKSMADMTQDEASRFIDWAIKEAAKLDLILPDPER
jgi:hypothetical protein